MTIFSGNGRDYFLSVPGLVIHDQLDIGDCLSRPVVFPFQENRKVSRGDDLNFRGVGRTELGNGNGLSFGVPESSFVDDGKRRYIGSGSFLANGDAEGELTAAAPAQ